MIEFNSWRAYVNFSDSVKRRARYVFDTGTQHFLDCLVATGASRSGVLPKGSALWRAQLHDDPNERMWQTAPFLPERMKPITKVKEGRISPKGIPCLYLAADEKTAMSEVRPWVGAIGTLGEFSTLKDLTIIDCSQTVVLGGTLKLLAASTEPLPEEREKRVWANINAALSEPVTSTDSTAEYAPTQVLAEVFRGAGYDGIRYKSSLGPGTNVALFDLAAADVVARRIFQTKAVRYDFSVSYKIA